MIGFQTTPMTQGDDPWRTIVPYLASSSSWCRDMSSSGRPGGITGDGLDEPLGPVRSDTAQLSGRRSFRNNVSNLDAQAHKLYHLGDGRVARSSLARVNREQPHELYEALFGRLLSRCQRGAGAWVPFPEQAVVARRHVRGPVPEGVSLSAVPQDQGGVEAARGSRSRGLSAVVPARHRRQGLGPRGGPVASSSEGEHRGGGPSVPRLRMAEGP